MFPPGYYKTNYRALKLREMIRWRGWFGGFQAWLKMRFEPASSTAWWMPGLWAENECRPEDLSPDFWQATKPHRADFEKLGFVQCRLATLGRVLNPNIRDNGSIFYLDATRCYFGQLIYSQHYRPSQGKAFNHIVIAFTAAFENTSLSCTNSRLSFDSPIDSKVIRLNSYDVPKIYERFRQELQRHRNAPRSFSDLKSLIEWFDSRQVKNFEDRVRRRLFIPMTESEVAKAQAMPRGGGSSIPRPLFRRKFRLEYWPLMVFAALLLLAMHRHQLMQRPDNTIEYQGQQFKTRQVYATYEDYKDDPNNLDTHELPRIEQTMEAVKIPPTFKDRKALINFMGNLEFPGYGWGSDTSVESDDGSTLNFESFEIPQAGKDRIIVIRESGESWRLLDDFVFETNDTNSISRVRLEHNQLQYFDATGRQVRKKSL